MSSCLLNNLPVELIHNIFEYLQAYEILQSFRDVNEYLNNIVNNYDRYILNFRHVLKFQFDLVCELIRPNQVISLTLVDDDETPDQCDLFFSYFNIEQFVNLQSIEIVSNSDKTNKQLTNLYKLKRLLSMILPITYRITSIDDIQKLYPQLRRFVTDTSDIINIKMAQLRYLKLTKYERSPLSYLSINTMPNLRSLDLTLSLSLILSIDWSNSELFWFQLKRLFLKTTDHEILSSISQFLPKLINLKHFEIDVQNASHVPNGQQWEVLVSHLFIFDFRFTIYEKATNIYEKQFQSFRSSFWLEQKRWFVAYDNQISSYSIFTVPRFAPIDINFYSNYQLLCTLSNFPFDQYVRSINISRILLDINRFTKLTTLNLKGKSDFDNNLSTLSFANLLNQLPHIHSLSFQGRWSTYYIPDNIIFEQIRSLTARHTFDECNNKLFFPLKQLCRVYPRLERLCISIHNSNEMLDLIDGLKYLSIAKFEKCHPISYFDIFPKWPKQLTQEWFIKHSVRLNSNHNFTNLFYHQDIHLWIGDKKSNEDNSSWLFCCLQ
ncbi:hypothetical protein I4U23_010740 [Adineta vaga]|nr:hypothetical protein I4U23_010740 [Adineta vaga]